MTLGTIDEAGNDESHFNKPTDVFIKDNGDIYVSDGYENRRIVQFDKNGKHVKSWGKDGIGKGDFKLPHSIDGDSKGNIYVADRSNARVQVFDKDGNFVAQWTNLLIPWTLNVTNDDDVWVCGS